MADCKTEIRWSGEGGKKGGRNRSPSPRPSASGGRRDAIISKEEKERGIRDVRVNTNR